LRSKRNRTRVPAGMRGDSMLVVLSMMLPSGIGVG
jgi:hypothetical protein